MGVLRVRCHQHLLGIQSADSGLARGHSVTPAMEEVVLGGGGGEVGKGEVVGRCEQSPYAWAVPLCPFTLPVFLSVAHF